MIVDSTWTHFLEKQPIVAQLHTPQISYTHHGFEIKTVAFWYDLTSTVTTNLSWHLRSIWVRSLQPQLFVTVAVFPLNYLTSDLKRQTTNEKWKQRLSKIGKTKSLKLNHIKSQWKHSILLKCLKYCFLVTQRFSCTYVFRHSWEGFIPHCYWTFWFILRIWFISSPIWFINT